MAFHQPVQHRVVRVEGDARQSSVDLAPQVRSGPDESQTWVLFSPATDAGTTTSYLSSFEDTQQTPGRSRISDLGSLGTLARSDRNSEPQNSAVPSDVIDESIAEEDAELDSLDSHLPEFRTIPSPYSTNPPGGSDVAPVLPGHDGLGSFRLPSQWMGAEEQEQLYAFERYNPRRVKRRRESMERAETELANEVRESDRIRRIEDWRLEQSRLLLDQIQKETRRRRQSETLSQRPRGGIIESLATASALDKAAEDMELSSNDWHDQDEPALSAAQPQDETWSRFTRRVIRDLMGIDDRLLSILFGEALPDEDDLSSTPKASALQPALGQDPVESSDDSSWHLRMLERFAQELGLLVHQMSTHHPGAFSTYKRMQQTPLPYAGLPVIPESAQDAAPPPQEKVEESSFPMPQFQPTVTQPVNIPGARSEPPAALQASLEELTGRPDPAETFTQQEWEQDLDIKLVFRYLRSRFSPSRAPPAFNSGTSHLATSSTQDAAAKAARVRQHHPLVSHSHPHGHQRTRPSERRTFKATSPASPVAIRHHRTGSCASQSTRPSARRSSVSSRHSSRHYWDIGGSIGTGSMIASTGPMGSWGEV
ncbi:hypothetical protein GQ53DRAFT_117623 [Thozetella sp. PMI_491]|nr:hypothetical protein GQ53DRAFT_117623 [Thozetella sp. PMI_491]